MQEFDRTIVESDTRVARRGAHSQSTGISDVTRFLKIVSGTAIIIVLLFGIWSVRNLFSFIGLLALGATVVLIVCGVTWVVISTVRHATRADYYPVEENGAYLRDSLGRVRPLAPMIAVQARVSRSTAKVEISPEIPSLFDLIESGEIAPGEMSMVMGYDKESLAKGILQLVVGPWPGTHAVAGKGRSGKTRRVIATIAQALIAGARVLICDPHHTKQDSLARSLEPLANYLTIARGEAQIVEQSRMFLHEMEARIDDQQRACTPWLIVFDEWSRLMDENNAKMPEGGRDLLIDVAKNCSSQYAGYMGFCCLIGQYWTNEHAGGTDIRRSLQSVFIHQLSAEYAQFFIKSAKWKNKAEELKRRECLYRDIENQVSIIVTVGVPDDTAQRIAGYLASIGMPAIEQPRSAQMEHYLLTEPTTASASTSTPCSEREIIISSEALPGRNPGSDVDALREIAKRLRNGESANEIRRRLGITGGRALQEVNAALNMLSQDEETGE